MMLKTATTVMLSALLLTGLAGCDNPASASAAAQSKPGKKVTACDQWKEARKNGAPAAEVHRLGEACEKNPWGD